MKIILLVCLGCFVGVVTPVSNFFSECWDECSKKNGWCRSYCGSDGLCCRQTYKGNGCDGLMGGKNHHRCTSDERGKSVRYRGQDCWHVGGCKSGSCAWCGTSGYCCRIGDPAGSGCDGKIGGDQHHLCAGTMANYDKNWMGRVSGEKYISQLTIPGTHDSAADHNIDCGGTTPWTQCQDHTISQQINMGVRFFDLRFKHKNNKFVINHGSCELGYTFEGILRTMKTFLQQNNQETILLSYSYYPDQDQNASRSFQNTLDWYLGQNQGLFYQGSGVPKLKDVRGKIVLINFGRYGRNTGAHGLLGKWNDNTVANNYTPWCDALITNAGCSGYVKSLVANMERAKQSSNKQLLYITYLSASNGLFPKNYANYVNPRIHNWALKQDGSRQAGIVVWDYVRDYHARLVYYMNLL